MRRVALPALILTLLALFALAPAALAWTPVVGCTFAGTSSSPLGPWTYGGTVTARQTSTQVIVGSGTLDANGCYSVTIGNGPQVTVTIDFTPGPSGDPANQTCVVPTDPNYTPAPYECSPIYTNTTSLAVSVSGFAGQSVASGWWLAPIAALAATALVWLRRK